MGMTFSCHQFGGTLAYSFLTLTAHELTGIHKESQKVEIVSPELLREEEAIPQPRVQILYHGAGSRRLSHRCLNRFIELMELSR